MNKKLLIRYIEGSLTGDEKNSVEKWILSSDMNRKYFFELKSLYVLDAVANENSSPDQRHMRMADEIKGKGKTKNVMMFMWWRYAAAAVFVISLGINIFLLSGGGQDENTVEPVHMVADIPDSVSTTIYTPKGAKSRVELPDGSVVWLNSDSRITYPNRFASDRRNVLLDGEGYFSVKSDSLWPMMIRAKDVYVMVKGTEFNLRAYENESSVSTTLISGKVTVYTKNEERDDYDVTVLKPKESFVVEEIPELTERPVVVSDYKEKTAWKDGVLYFKSTPVEQVLKDLERWYGVSFVVKDPGVYDYRFTATVYEQASIDNVLDILRYCSLIDYRIDKTVVTLFLRK